MQSKLSLLVLASALAGCSTYVPHDEPQRGVETANQPVVSRQDYALDLATGDGFLSPAEAARLDGWFQSMGLGYGDTVYLGGPNAETVRGQVAQVAGRYGLLLASGLPAAGGPLAPGATRVVVSRITAAVPGCPKWEGPTYANSNNHSLPGLGCGVNSALAMMVADPNDLVYGRSGGPVSDPRSSSKAIQMYRGKQPTGTGDLKETNSKGN
ncbi:CpaD family pilus assembly protein [Sphingomonas ginkgonis]|uniref:CpaD family pilus assembly protein n=1 Tax=Sphingomonas ginkgonis TaxID=2315330 RepID=UPI00163A1F74|nr:CpaD family pilus assembly lipoprotein [Sphingomonas ginkgonis]